MVGGQAALLLSFPPSFLDSFSSVLCLVFSPLNTDDDVHPEPFATLKPPQPPGPSEDEGIDFTTQHQGSSL